jgi:hypothetical protein
MIKLVIASVGSCVVLTLIACSGASGDAVSNSIVPTVQAQSGYSNASLSGTYSVTFSSNGGQIPGGNPYIYSALGTIQLNGAGVVTGGVVTFSFSGSPAVTCVENVGGTYSLQSSALGTASLSFTQQTGSCSTSFTIPLSIAAAGQGTTVLFQGSGPVANVLSGVASKQ